LSQAFLAGLDEPARARARALPDLEHRLHALYEASRAVWPQVQVDAGAFMNHLAGRLVGQEDLRDALDVVRGPDLYFAFACLGGVKPALSELERRFVVQVPRVLRRLRLRADSLEDLAQELRTKLLVASSEGPPRIAEYAGRGPLDNWLRAVTMRTALSMMRKRNDPSAPTSDAQFVEKVLGELKDSTGGPEVALVRERYAGELLAATLNAIRALPAGERMLLRLHFADGLGIDDIGRILRVHRATAARRTARLRESLQLAVQAELSAKLRLSPSEFASVMRGVRSHLDLRLSKLLGP
jgi:RNA polymerase sigma-70 factor (ECF subfamily)